MLTPTLIDRLKIFVVAAIGLFVAAFLGKEIGVGNYIYLAFEIALLLIAAIASFSGAYYWPLTIASSFLAGTFPVLGGQFTPFQILIVVGIAKFVIADIVFGRVKPKIGRPLDTLLITGFMLVLTWHGLHDRFGMRFLGSNMWGGRNYVNAYIGLAGYCVIQSIPMSPKIWARLPYFILAVSGFDLTIALITTIFPSSIYTIYPFYSAVSQLGIEDIFKTDLDVTQRIGAFGNFGFMLIIFTLSTISVRKVFTLPNLRRLLPLLAGSILVLYSGFRSAVLNTLLAGLMAGIRDLKWAVLALLPIVALFLLGLSIVNSEFVALPKQVQRGLVFIPGKWDVEMARDAAASNEFRQAVWSLWAREYFPQQPLLGRGFGFRSEWASADIEGFTTGRDTNQRMVETGNMHNGLLSSLDSFGLIGTIFFVIWNLRLLALTFRVPWPENDSDGLALRFLALYLAVSITSYWIGALSVGTFLPQEFAVAAVFLRLQREIASRPLTVRSDKKPLRHELQEQLATA